MKVRQQLVALQQAVLWHERGPPRFQRLHRSDVHQGHRHSEL
jgi:hypothetical protein